MKKYILISLYVGLIISFGCESTDIIETDIGHKEYIVVQGDLINGKVFEGLTITKTLPLDDVYDKSRAIIKNVTAYIKVNGKQVIPLHFNDNGTYMPLYRFTPGSGNIYELFADIDGETIYSKTFVPGKPQPISSVIRNNECVEIQVRQHSEEVYGALWVIRSGTSIIAQSKDFQNVESGNSNSSSYVTIVTQNFGKEFQKVEYRNNIYYRVIAFDKAYSDFFKTRVNSEPIENSLLNGGGPVIWNVFGNNVIGLFIGSCEGDLQKVN